MFAIIGSAIVGGALYALFIAGNEREDMPEADRIVFYASKGRHGTFGIPVGHAFLPVLALTGEIDDSYPWDLE